MQVKSVLLTVGIGAVAGAATMLLIPRHSEAYRLADGAAHSLKEGAERVIDTVRSHYTPGGGQTPAPALELTRQLSFHKNCAILLCRKHK